MRDIGQRRNHDHDRASAGIAPLALLTGLASAALFGLATPLSKILLTGLSQLQLAGLLYLGAGLGTLPFVVRARLRGRRMRLDRRNAIRLLVAVALGGVVGPVLLLMGLTEARASSVSLWLNLELAATAALGALFFRDQLGPWGWAGVAGALVAGLIVTAGEGAAGAVPALLVAGACMCWGMDNNLTSLIDGLTPQEVTCIKGLAAGVVNLGLGLLQSRALAPAAPALASLGLGAVCYGGSIVLFILTAQRLGAARGQVLFAAAPFIGAGFSLLLPGEKPTWTLAAATAVLAASVALMRRARHAHVHHHEAQTHVHAHRHNDLHHLHAHPGRDPTLVHVHEHAHEDLEHDHPHVPDIHHRHGHDTEARQT